MKGQTIRKTLFGSGAMMILVVWLIGPASAAAKPQIAIEMNRSASVDGDIVYLGDVARIASPDHAQVLKLSGIKLGPAPLYGQSRLIPVDEIALRLKQNGLDEPSYRIQAAGPVKVLRRYAVIKPDRVNAAVTAFIQQHAPWDPDQLKIGKLTFNSDLPVPPGKATFQVTAPLHTDWLGPVPFSVQVLVDGQPARKITAPATIEVWSNVVVAIKPLGKFQPIQADDILVKRMNLARTPANVIMAADQVLGRRTNRNIAANTLLRTDQVEMPPVVKRGDLVEVIAESPVLKISTKAIARQNGAVGDRIPVMNLRSKKIIYAQVVNKQTVMVEF
jgi:flagellar basal body P-ring formation protein FlgA